MGEHVSDALCRATRASILVEDGGEVFALAVVDIGRQLYFALLCACLAACHILGRLWLGRFVVLEIGEDAAVYLDYFAVGQGVIFDLCRCKERRHKA